MSKWNQAALGFEATFLVAFAVLAAGVAGRSTASVAALGAALLLSLTMPSLYLLLWGRARSNVEFMASLVGSIMGKAVVVGVAVVVVNHWTGLPVLPFVFGMMGGWVLSFTIQGVALQRTLPRAPGPAAP